MAISTNDLHWAAGFLEGEGSFTISRTNKNTDSNSFRARVCVGQKDREPLEKLQQILGGAIHFSPAPSRTNPIYFWQVGGPRAIAVMMTFWTLLSGRRRAQIESAIDQWKTASTKPGKYIQKFIPKRIRRPRRKLSDADVCEIRTATGTLAEIAGRFGINRHYCFKLRKRERRTNVL